MPFDGLTLSILCRELGENLTNARVARITQPDRHVVLLQLRKPGETVKLLISPHPGAPRMHCTRKEFSNPLTPPAFCMLLRKHLEPSRLLSVQQTGAERIVFLQFEAQDEKLKPTRKTLVFELMGRHSNLILVDRDNMILDAFHRIGPDCSGVRTVMPGILYQPPPDQGKVDPFSVPESDFVTGLRLLPATATIAQAIVKQYQGFSPVAAREVLFRATLPQDLTREQITAAKDPDPIWQQIWHSFRTFLEHIQKGGAPCLATRPKRDMAGYRFTEATEQDCTSYSTVDHLAEDYYTDRLDREQLQQYQSRLGRVINRHMQRIQKKEKLQQKALENAAAAAEWQQKGNLILAHLNQVKKGDRSLTAIDYGTEDGQMTSIELNPALSPIQNANYCFKRYTKAKKSKKIVLLQLKKTQRERRYLEELETHIQLAEDIDQLTEIESELVQARYIRQKPSDSKKAKMRAAASPNEYVSREGISLFVGRNNRQNDELTFKTARPQDLWLHAQKIPGSHVIIRATAGMTDQTIEDAALLAAYFSQARNSPKVAVDYTERRHVRKPKGAKPGFVLYDQFQTITVDPTSGSLPVKKS